MNHQWSYVPPATPGAEITQVSTESSMLSRQGGGSEWNGVLNKLVENTLGFSAVNERQNQSVPWTPVPQAKPPPRMMLLRWQDRSFDSGTTLAAKYSELNQFGWNMPENISGFDSMTLFSMTTNMTWFQQFGQYLGVQLDLDGTPVGSNMITSADGRMNSGALKLVSPTWLAPNSAGSGAVDVTNTSNMGSPDPRNSVWAASLRGRSFGSVRVTLCDESLLPLAYVGSNPPTGFYFYIQLLLQ